MTNFTAIMMAGARPVFADLNPARLTLDPRAAEDIRALIARFAATPRDVIEDARKAVIE